MLRETALIRELKRRFPARAGVRTGIGDDAAVLEGDRKRDWVVTTDLMIEGVHFWRRTQPATAVGWKALARSLSDAAAMAARPRYALVALAVPRALASAWVKSCFDGIGRLARRFGVDVIGGDLSAAPQIVIDVQVLGEVRKGAAVLRRGARSGDVLFVSGTLGLAGLGLVCVRKKVARTSSLLKRAARAHFLPEPRLALAWELARRGATSMIDLSDGLSTDLSHICAASRVGARVQTDQIPAVELSAQLQKQFHISGLELALTAGEDYELLFTLPTRQAARLPKKLAGVRLTRIGEMTRRRDVKLVGPGGEKRPLLSLGWDHFSRPL